MPNQTFTGTGWHDWNVPKDVQRVTVTLTGAGAGGGGQQAGKVVGDLLVNDGQVLQCFVGEHGVASSGSTGGTGGSGGGVRGGDGHQGFNGGDGGGGATYIRMNTHDGSLKCVAGGAGGDSGDGGNGGAGGTNVGGNGHNGSSGTGPTGVATGGTQNQGGNGGQSSAGNQFDGADATNGVLDQGGRGGEANSGVRCHGGGGGGGGYHPGGGGQASNPGYAPGGGGGGGSNYTGGLTNIKTNSQTGGTGSGSVSIDWVTPSPANQPPSPPTTVQLNGNGVSDLMHTKIIHQANVSAIVNDPDNDPAHPTDTSKGDTVRLVIRWSENENLANYKQSFSDTNKPYTERTKRATATIDGLVQDTRYWVRVYAQDNHGLMSTNYTGFSFYTNETAVPDTLTVNSGGSGVSIASVSSATFAWKFNDPDAGDLQSGFQLRYRVLATSSSPPGDWTLIDRPSTADNTSPSTGPPASSRNQWVFNPGTFRGSTYYEWQVRTYDQAGSGSDWSMAFTFYSTSTTAPPVLLSPIKDAATDTSQGVTFSWKFVDPDPTDTQQKADIRWQTVDQSIPPGIVNTTWTTVLGTSTVPGATKTWAFPATTFTSGYEYRWEVRTYDHLGNVSDWSSPGLFWATGTPGSAGGPDPIPELMTDQGTLGCGEYRVFIYEQGGRRIVGEIPAIAALQFARVRDDISVCTLLTNGLGDSDCCEFYSSVRSWMHELVVFRSGVRVWEGPITRITYTTTDVEFEARDVMVYVYRRVMREGYNDAYRITERNPDGSVKSHEGVVPVITRAERIIANALAPHDPNVLPYLTTITSPRDANETIVRPNWSTTAWEEVDGLAATAGLDYTVVGRRIILWDTHTPIGRLPTMTDGDFSDSPIVSEYGMQTCTFMAVTNGSGIAGSVSVDNPDRPPGTPPFYPYGPIEMLASGYGAAAAASEDALTREGLHALVSSLNDQATRNIAHRFPTPLIVRIPDNSSLSPECAVGFQQLVPGVWIPLRASGTCRVVTQWQKLDSVTVNVDQGSEKVQVVMSPAPKGGQDPDAEATDTET